MYCVVVVVVVVVVVLPWSRLWRGFPPPGARNRAGGRGGRTQPSDLHFRENFPRGGIGEGKRGTRVDHKGVKVNTYLFYGVYCRQNY